MTGRAQTNSTTRPPCCLSASGLGVFTTIMTIMGTISGGYIGIMDNKMETTIMGTI